MTHPYLRRNLAILLAALGIAACTAPGGASSGDEGALGESSDALTLTTFEAETMSLPSGGAARSDVTASAGSMLEIWSNGAATKTVILAAPVTQIVIRARGDQCAGAPDLDVSFDGAHVATVAVAASTWTSYTVNAKLGAGSHRVAISFTNDALRPSCDRNLYLDKVSFALATVGAPVAPTFFGMSNYISNPAALATRAWPDVPFGAVRLWDTYTEWAFLEPTSYQGISNSKSSHGHYAWASLDSWVSHAALQKTEVLYTFGMVPSWASSNPTDTACHRAKDAGGDSGGCDTPADLHSGNAYWKEFVTALVTRYKGRIAAYELWNEANLCNHALYPQNCALGSSDPEWNGSVAELVQMGRDAAAIIHALDPAARVVSPSVTKYAAGCTSPSCGQVFMKDYLSLGGKDFVDVVAFHSYLTSVPEDVVGAASAYVTAKAAGGAAQLPLWDTEGSWCGSTCAFAAYPANAAAQAAFVARSYLLHLSSGLERFYWYAWDSALYGSMWDATHGTRAPGVAYGEVGRWIVGAALVAPCSSNGSVWTCDLVRNGGLGRAVWNTAGASSYAPLPEFKHARHLDGSVDTLTPAASIAIGAEPILLENQ